MAEFGLGGRVPGSEVWSWSVLATLTARPLKAGLKNY